MKKTIFAFCGLAFISGINAGPIVNVEYIHDAIKQRWNIDVPYSENLTDRTIAANMEYLLTTIDVANAIIQHTPVTSYGTGEYATTRAVDTIAADTAIETLISINYPFIITTTDTTKSFSFNISAAGTFYVDCGADATEKLQPIIKDDTTVKTITCNWPTAGEHTVRIGGSATGYSTDATTAAISFEYSINLASIDGSLGAIFPTIDNGDGTLSQPRFYQTFFYCYNLEGIIPENLFAGIKGEPAPYMFYNTFYACSSLTSIPENLFAGISGAPASGMFGSTFSGCSSLTSIPENLFAGISGAPAEWMFSGTFSGCSGLKGEIPANLFSEIKGEPAPYMFYNTFYGCSSLTSIPENLFAGISGAPAPHMFNGTFSECSSLTSIPEKLFAGIKGEPASYMFNDTFSECSGLTGNIPSGLFGELSGAPADSMFYGTFSSYFGSSLTGPAARNGGDDNRFLHEIWPDAETYMYTNANGIDGWDYISTNWGGGGQTCAAGTYFNSDKTECLTCDAGYYCLGGTKKPIECSWGYTSDPGSSECYYTITVDTNNDENIVETIKCNIGTGCLLPPVTATKPGYVASGQYCSMRDGRGICYNANERHVLVNGQQLYVDYKPVYSITLVNNVSDEFKEAPLPQPYSFWLMYGTKWCADSECKDELTKLSDIPEFVGYDFAGVRTNAVAWADTTANDIVDANGNFITDTAALTTTKADATATVQWNRGTTYCEPGSYYAGHYSTLSPCTRCVQSGITLGKYCPGGEFDTNYAAVYDGIADCPDGGTTSVSDATLADCYKTETRSDIGNTTRQMTCYIDENNQYTKDCVSSGIIACNPGYYIANSGDTECSPVGYGYYSTGQTERKQCTKDRINGLTPTTETETASALSECYVTNGSGNKCYYMSAYSKYYCY